MAIFSDSCHSEPGAKPGEEPAFFLLLHIDNRQFNSYS
jgi:hypothetical protein